MNRAIAAVALGLWNGFILHLATHKLEMAVCVLTITIVIFTRKDE